MPTTTIFFEWLVGIEKYEDVLSTVLRWQPLATISWLFSPWRWLNQGWRRSLSEGNGDAHQLCLHIRHHSHQGKCQGCFVCWRFFLWKMPPPYTMNVTLMLPTVWILHLLSHWTSLSNREMSRMFYLEDSGLWWFGKFLDDSDGIWWFLGDSGGFQLIPEENVGIWRFLDDSRGIILSNDQHPPPTSSD